MGHHSLQVISASPGHTPPLQGPTEPANKRGLLRPPESALRRSALGVRGVRSGGQAVGDHGLMVKYHGNPMEID